MTEASHQIASNPLPPGERRAGSVGLATGVEVAVVDGSGLPVATGATGEIVVSGPTVMRGYERDSAAGAGAFLGPWLRTGDLGHLDADGYLFITGRLTEIINRGGAKIAPQEVDEVLAEHPSVAEAVTFAIPHPSLGEDVAAAVVLREHAAATVQELRAFAGTRLAEFKVPSRVIILPEIPQGQNGKPRRAGLAERLGLPALDDAAPLGPDGIAPPRTATEAALAAIWAQVLDLGSVGVHDDFFQLGGDSILATLVASRVGERLGTDLAVRDIFDAPTLSSLAARIDAAHRPDPDRRRGSLAIPVVSRDGGLPPSFAQESFWLADQLALGSTPYNEPAVFRLLGSLDVGALARSLEEVVRRHEVLRTVFTNVDGQLRQVIAAPSTFPLPLIDLRAVPETERETQARRIAAREGRRPFDLSRDPGLRAALLRLGDADHVLTLTTHEAVADRWSLGILLGELALLYGASCARRPAPLPPPRLQYADYAVWQRAQLSGPIRDAHLAYWRHRLGGAPALEMPTDRPRPTVASFRGASRSCRLRGGASARLKALSRQEGVTLFMTLLAAFQVLLHRYSGQDDILVGSPVAGRTRVELEGLVGCFVNTVVLRTDMSGTPTFRQLLGRVRTVALGAYAHQDAPFESVVEALQPSRTLSHPPLFRVMFALENAPTWTPTLAGLSVHPWELPKDTATVDLSLSMRNTPHGLIGTLRYSSDLFDADTVAGMLGQFETLLDGVATDPDRPVSRLALLTEPERHQLLVQWNDTRVAFPDEGLVHQLIEAQVERTPDAVAAVFEGAQLSYRELNARANGLAHRLRTLGVGPDTCVGLYLERSLEMVVGILGTLKAGGAYMPLDAAYPRERLASMVELAQAPVLLTQERLKERLPPHRGRVVCLDGAWEVTAGPSAGNPPSTVTGDNLAYVIFTSGSTGQPKGVMNTHQGIRNRLLWMQQAYGLTESDRVLQKTPFGFDVSVWEFLWPLMTGARLVVARPGGHQDRAYLVDLIATQGITTVHFVPAMLRVFLDAPGLEAGGPLRRVISSGEALTTDLQERFFARLGAELHNLYGPTEAAVDVTSWACRRGSSGPVVPIGRPIANIQIYLLDAHLEPVPVGIPGELHIGGVGLARGYLGRPDLTAERFIPDPFSAQPGSRLYKTGDLARYRPDGRIEFLRRVDQQVKVNGIRVETGEIEVALGRHPGVKEAVVLAREDTPGDQRLVAYVVAVEPPAPSAPELRHFLKRELPEFMVPSSFVELPRLPWTPHGKVDRHALPAPDRTRPDLGQSVVAPRGPLEEALARIWADILGVERVSVHDDFFELGGHSLMAIRIVSRIREALGVELPLRRIFEMATVAEVAAAIPRAGAAAAGDPTADGLPVERV